MTKTMQLVLAATMVSGSMAGAQQMGMQPVTAVLGIAIQVADSTVAVVPGKEVKDDLFAGTEKFAQGATDVTEINLDPKMMGMVGGSGKGDAELARKMKFMVIHTYTYDKPGMYRMEDVEAYRKKLADGTWSCSIHVRDKDGSTDICSRTSADHEGSEMVILTAEPKELTFIHMSGTMSLDELGKMGGAKGSLKRR